MAKRSSKTKKKQPELRTGGGRAAKAERARKRQAVATRNAPTGPAVRVRPAGFLGWAWVFLLSALVVALVAWVGLLLDRWNLVSYPDSLWMYVAFGMLVAAPAIGRVGRSVVDADVWGLLALLVPGGMLVAELVLGPPCPNGARCESVGARGSLGLLGSILLVVGFAVLSWGIARWQYRSAVARRPANGRVRYGIVTGAIVGMLVFPGLLLGAATIGGDILLRGTPKLVEQAADQVRQECFGLEAAPKLAVRSAPRGNNPQWITFAVRRANESRPGVGKKPLPDNWATYDSVHPYEATASFNGDDEVVSITCRRVGPGTGNAVADDLKQPDPDTNPLSNKTIGSNFLPRFFTQGVAGPSEEAKKQAAEKAKASKADAAKDAAKDGK